MSVNDFLDWVNRGKTTHPKDDSTIPWTGVPSAYEEGQLGTNLHCFLLPGLEYSNHDVYTRSVCWDVEISLTSSSYLCGRYCHCSKSNGNHLNPNSLSELSRKPLGTVAMTTVCWAGAWEEEAWCVSSHGGNQGPTCRLLRSSARF